MNSSPDPRTAEQYVADVATDVATQVADDTVNALLDRLTELAAGTYFTQMDRHTAARRLAEVLEENVRTEDLTTVVANLLIDKVRHLDTTPALDTHAKRTEYLLSQIASGETGDDIVAALRAGMAAEQAAAEFAGAEVRIIGPEKTCRRILRTMSGSGIPLVGPRGPMDARHRDDDAVRFYAYTDHDTKNASRNRDRERRRGGRDTPQ